MATLALALCHPDCYLSVLEPRATWVPATDKTEGFTALLGGLTPEPLGSGERDLLLRVQGETRAVHVRTNLLERALPIPEEPPSPQKIERFRRRHADKLPAFRRHLEGLIDRTLALNDEVLQFRALERIPEEVNDPVPQVEAYLHEGGFRRVRRSPLVRMLKFIPALSGPVTAAQEVADALETAPHIETEPLAYLAFAQVELDLNVTYRAQAGATSLAEAFAG